MYEDPYFQDIPWEIFYDDDGCIMGVLYVLLPKKLTARKGNLQNEKYAW